MMRKLMAVAMAVGAIGVGGFAQNALAGATVDLLFVAKNGNPIAATNTVTLNPGEVASLEMIMVMRNDQQLSAHGFSINYDLEGFDLLEVTAQSQWAGVSLNKAGTAKYNPLGALSAPTDTLVGSFNSTNNVNTLNLFLPNSPGGGYQIGTVIWQVNPNSNGGESTDLVVGIITGLDGLGNNLFQSIPNLAQFNGATVNVIPEPGTALLVGFGLVGLVLAGRRNRA